MADVSQILPPESLTEVLEHVSVPDVLKFEQVRTLVSVAVLTDYSWCFQVNRAFRDVILASQPTTRQRTLHEVSRWYARSNPSRFNSAVRSGVRLTGVPCQQWEILLPIADPTGYGFCLAQIYLRSQICKT